MVYNGIGKTSKCELIFQDETRKYTAAIENRREG